MENKRVVYFDILNIIAMIAVVSMHCNGIVYTIIQILELGIQV